MLTGVNILYWVMRSGVYVAAYEGHDITNDIPLRFKLQNENISCSNLIGFQSLPRLPTYLSGKSVLACYIINT